MTELGSDDRLVVYVDVAGQFRWRRLASNGEMLSRSEEPFTRHDNAVRAAERANPDLKAVAVARPPAN